MQCGGSIQTKSTLKGDTYRFQPVSYLGDTHGPRSMDRPVYPDDSLILVGSADFRGKSLIQECPFLSEAKIIPSDDCTLNLRSLSLGDRYLGQAVKGQEVRFHTDWSLIRTREGIDLEMGKFGRGDKVWVQHYPDGSIPREAIPRPDESVRLRYRSAVL